MSSSAHIIFIVFIVRFMLYFSFFVLFHTMGVKLTCHF